MQYMLVIGVHLLAQSLNKDKCKSKIFICAIARANSAPLLTNSR
jgi:hypothetical protein